MTDEIERERGEHGAHGGVTPGQYYEHGLPYLPLDTYPGRIIAIEGTDGVGPPRRSGCCANGSRCSATASPKRGGPARA